MSGNPLEAVIVPENNSKFYLVNVVSAVLYDLQIFGIKISTLKRRGLM